MSGRIDLQLGYSCNSNCIHCFNLDIIRELRGRGKSLDKSMSEIKKIILKAKEEGIGEVVLTGGEPTIRKDFLEILRFIKENEFKISLQTNGRMFSSQDFTKKVSSIAPDIGLLIPIHHVNPKIHDSVTRVKGSWAETMKGINYLKKYEIDNIFFKTIILKQNYRNLIDITEYANTIGINNIDFAFLEGSGRARKNWFKIAPHYSEIAHPLKDSIKLGNKWGMNISVYDVPFCFLKGFESHISEIKSYVIPYLSGNFPKRISSSRSDNIIEELVLKRRKKIEKCTSCKYFKVCLGVWSEYIEFYGGSEFKPVKGEKISNIRDLRTLLEESN